MNEIHIQYVFLSTRDIFVIIYYHLYKQFERITCSFYILVPTVVHSEMNNQIYSKQQTTYNKHFGSQHADVSSVFSSIQPQVFQQFAEHLASVAGE